jgi:phosphoglycerate dehydrogenase-like enzyme
MSDLKIGFVGLGDQGTPMAEAISDAGFELHVWARRVQSFDVLSGVKYLRHNSLDESLAPAVDVLCFCLRDDEDIWGLIRQQRLTEALRRGAIVVNYGTGDPTENQRIGATSSTSRMPFALEVWIPAPCATEAGVAPMRWLSLRNGSKARPRKPITPLCQATWRFDT